MSFSSVSALLSKTRHQLVVLPTDLLHNTTACNTCPFHLMTMLSFILIIQGGLLDNWYKMLTQTYELAEKCIQTNYYGNKRMCEALIPLLAVIRFTQNC